MVGRLAALVEDLDQAARELGDLAEYVGEQRAIDQARARAGGQNPIGLQHVEGARG